MIIDMKPYIHFFSHTDSVDDLLNACKHEFWMMLGRHTITLRLFKIIEKRTDGLGVVNRDTDLVIEGYPRSANTFTLVAFQMAQKVPVSIAHHIHGPGQIILASKWQIPILVTIRNPIDAVASLLVRYPYLSPALAFRNYFLFYHLVEPYMHRILLAPFEEVVSDFGTTIDRLNHKYGSNFDLFEHSRENVAKCYARIDELDTHDRGDSRADTLTVARPASEREEAKRDLLELLGDPSNNSFQSCATGIYKKYIQRFIQA